MTKKYAMATARNREPILSVLQKSLPSSGNILEIASGSGEHAVYFAAHFPQHKWYPSDKEAECLQSIAAWQRESALDNLQSPQKIDVSEVNWYNSLSSVDNITTIICINMIHISPWQTCIGLITGAKEILPRDGIVYLYGPYQINNQHTAPSNEEFDRYLRMQNPLWGVRNLEDVLTLAQENGFVLEQQIAMPANNFSLIFRKNS